jgi:uncharacterized membrane protein (UPF0136 family)
MLRLLLNSGLYSVALWAALCTFVVVLASWLRCRTAPEGHGLLVPGLFSSSVFLVFLALGAFFNLGYGLYRAYVAPRDILQDIVSAQECLAGRSLYPDHMNELFQMALEREGDRPSPFWWSDSFRAREEEARQENLREHWVQAHPPFSTLVFVPLVAALGVLGAQSAFTLLSLMCLLGSLFLVVRGLGLHLQWRHLGCLILFALGVEPVVTVFRGGQTGLALGFLLIVGWYQLRRGWPVLAGICVALASGLKMFPGLLFLYLLIRHRRAFASALVTLAALLLFTGLVTGWDTFAEYASTAREVTEEYQVYPSNLSLLGLVSRLLGPEALGKARVVFFILGGLIGTGLVWLLSRRPRPAESDPESLDLEYSLFISLMPLLSPISWDHYLSVLILPLVVLGRRALTPSASWGAALGFLGMVVVLSIPDTSFTWPFSDLEGNARFVVSLVVLPLRTYALLALCSWLAVLVYRRQEKKTTDESGRAWPGKVLLVLGILALPGLLHVLAYSSSEPWFNGDETRHLMTGVFVRDAFLDMPVSDPRAYAIRYYLQYPALGLLVWPPFFYLVEGAFMLAVGTSLLAGQVLVGLFGVMACLYLFRLAERTHGPAIAALASLLLLLSPLVFFFTTRVMLEVPALALGLMATYHCYRYLEEERRRDLLLCCLATALTALTRFDGLYLAPLFLIWLAGARRLRLLLRPSVLAGMAGAVLLVAPFYLLTVLEMGGAHLKAAGEGTSSEVSSGFLAPGNFVFYPLSLPQQVGWFILPLLLVGLAVAFLPKRRTASWPYLALLLAVYLTFTPLAELEERHAIYWIPALTVFAADGCRLLASLAFRRQALAFGLLTALVVSGTAVQALQDTGHYVRGYEEAARYTVVENRDTPVCLFDGYLGGNFIYQVRRHDPARRLWVLRGDKLFYGMLSDPHGGYAEWATNQDEVLALLFKYDPEVIVVEMEQIYFDLPGSRLLRQTLAAHPERFRLERTIPLDSNLALYRGKHLLVYRNLLRNPHRVETIEVKMLGLGRSLKSPASP